MRFANSLVAAVMIMAVSVSALPSTFEQDDVVARDVSVIASPLELRGSGLSNGKHCSKSSECNSGNCCRGTCKVKKSNGKGCYKNANCKSGYCYHKKCTGSSHPSHPGGNGSNGGSGGNGNNGGGGGNGNNGGDGNNGGGNVVTQTQTVTQNGVTRTITATVTNSVSATPSFLAVAIGGQTLTLPVGIPATLTLLSGQTAVFNGLAGVFTAANGAVGTAIPAAVTGLIGGLNNSPLTR